MRVRPVLLIAPVLVAALLVPVQARPVQAQPVQAQPVQAQPVQAQDDKGGWPFGGQGGFRGKDLYNLGLLGVKVRDPARSADRKFETGRRSASATDAGPMADEGPNRLFVELLLPDGPGDKAGLQVGDVIVGAPKAFKDGSLAPIVAALLKTESGKSKGILTLRVERAGEKGTLKVPVEIPQGGKPAAKPMEDPHRQAIVDASLNWLADHQNADGGFPETLCGANGAVVQTSLAGLAWLAGGSDLTQGPYKSHVAGAAEFVSRTVGVGSGLGGRGGGTSDAPKGPSWDQTNWGYAHAAIFLGELQQRSPDDGVKDKLIECGRSLAERQEASGGWAHGPGGANALGYLELNIVTGLALCGIGMAGQAGYEVPEDVIIKAAAYLSDSGGGDGGVAYSHKSGQRGQGNIGRTAGAWLGFKALGLGGGKLAKKMEKYCRSHAGESMGGHASLQQHVFLSGVAAHAQGGEARKRFWATHTSELSLSRAPDGSFQPRPWHETLSIGSNSDVSVGEVWMTATWAIVLACEPSKDGSRPGLPAWMGLAK